MSGLLAHRLEARKFSQEIFPGNFRITATVDRPLDLTSWQLPAQRPGYTKAVFDLTAIDEGETVADHVR
jgi:hypothetical protein